MLANSAWNDSKLWISHALVFLHCVVNVYPESPTIQDKLHHLDFFNSLINVLPCKECRVYSKVWLKNNPLERVLVSRTKFKIWMTNFHNYIHLCLNRPRLLHSCSEGDDIILKFAKRRRKFMGDYDPNMWRFTKIWGAHAWVFLHCIGNTFPSRSTAFQKEQYRTFFNALLYVLPCKLCQQHYSQWIQAEPIHDAVSSSNTLKRWIFNLHNHVNMRLDKKLLPDICAAEENIIKFALKSDPFV
jgi:Erv1 / Alr family